MIQEKKLLFLSLFSQGKVTNPRLVYFFKVWAWFHAEDKLQHFVFSSAYCLCLLQRNLQQSLKNKRKLAFALNYYNFGIAVQPLHVKYTCLVLDDNILRLWKYLYSLVWIGGKRKNEEGRFRDPWKARGGTLPRLDVLIFRQCLVAMSFTWKLGLTVILIHSWNVSTTASNRFI